MICSPKIITIQILSHKMNDRNKKGKDPILDFINHFSLKGQFSVARPQFGLHQDCSDDRFRAGFLSHCSTREEMRIIEIMIILSHGEPN